MAIATRLEWIQPSTGMDAMESESTLQTFATIAGNDTEYALLVDALLNDIPIRLLAPLPDTPDMQELWRAIHTFYQRELTAIDTLSGSMPVTQRQQKAAQRTLDYFIRMSQS